MTESQMQVRALVVWATVRCRGKCLARTADQPRATMPKAQTLRTRPDVDKAPILRYTWRIANTDGT